jgi:putative thioredoxin
LPVASDEAAAEAEIEPLIAMGEQVLAEGDAERAIGIFRQIAEIAPANPEVHGGFVRALVAAGQLEEAEQHLAGIDAEAAKAPEIARAQSALALAKEAPAIEDLTPLQAAVDAAPDDHAARYELAGGQMAAGDHDAAANSLLHIIAAERDWNEGAARTRLLKLFEVVGLEDPWVGQQRRKLSAILFG